MASASETKSSQKETITCSICQDKLQQPRRLKCLHSFCGKCLKKVDRVMEKGRRGILCPICRRFTSEPHIKKDPILDVLVEAFSKYYDENILNQSPVDKSCSQCGRNTNVTYYCTDCKTELCQTCKTRHMRFEAMREHKIVPITEAGTHPVVNVTQYCPKHPSKPIKVSCVLCKLAICVDCKLEAHDTHKTEDIETALSSVLPEVRASCPVLETEITKQIEGKKELASLVNHLTRVQEQILDSAAKAKDDIISKANRDFYEIKERVTNHVQAVTKEASLREDDLNMCISSVGSMTSRINVLADMAQGSAVLYEVRNEKLLEQIQSLLRGCKQTRNIREFQKKAGRRMTFTKTDVKCDNIIGTVEFDEPEVVSARHNKSKLWGAECEKGRRFTLKRECFRFIHHQGSLWCPCPDNNTLDVYTPEGKLQTSVTCEGVNRPRSLHPLSATQMMLAARSGLFVYDIAKQAVSTILLNGEFLDVHVEGENVVALEDKKSGNRVHVFIATDPPTETHSFSVNHSEASSLILNREYVYVNSYGNNTSVRVFTLDGQLLSQWGKRGDLAPGEMSWPRLCGVDSEDCLIIADSNNHRVQLVNSSGEFSVLRGVKVEYPRDVAVVGGKLLVLHGYSEKYIETFQIR